MISAPFQRTAKTTLAIAALLALAGCLTTPPSTMLRLSRMSPLEADPAAIRLAARLPGPLRVRDGDIRLRISFDGGTAATRLVEEYGAVVVEAPAGTPGIGDDAEGSRTYVAALTPDDAASLADVQRRIRSWRAAGIEGEGQLSVMATACAEGPVPDGPIRLTTWMRTAPDDSFFVLTRNADLRRQIGDGTLAQIGRCGAG
ncbi:MAG: hypothetical protein JJ920_11855 [Roseitalea sp.]|jgi:hypothetical protein|nr:hypothetical protein [Roseitalea sp.]MBO6722934.1 hypothetical protein [Roseitalea sp.]MBO6743600.1 hypothetical protein [Roseitalea sp.]